MPTDQPQRIDFRLRVEGKIAHIIGKRVDWMLDLKQHPHLKAAILKRAHPNQLRIKLSREEAKFLHRHRI